MDYFEILDLVKKMYPGKKCDCGFDANCLRKIEIVLTEGKPNPSHHLEYNKIKVSPEGSDPIYMPIDPHRDNISWDDLKNQIAGM